MSFTQRSVRTFAASLALSAVIASPALMNASAHAESASPASTKSLAGVIPFTDAEVTHIGDSDWTVSWTAPADVTSVQVFVGTGATTFPATATTTSTHATGAVTVSSATRPWVKLVASYGAPLVITSRSLEMASDANLRDAGGYRTTTGQWVKFGSVLRSQALAISDADKPAFDALGVVTDYDLRTSCEAFTTPDYLPAGVERVHLNVMGDGGLTEFNSTTCAQSQVPSGLTTPDQAAAYMTQGEVGMVENDTAKAAYKALYTGILADDGVSLYHCTAGKDRTGWASAALLTLLGVPAADVMDDYLLSNKYYYATAGKAAVDYMNSQHAGAGELYKPFMQVRAEYLQAGLDEVKSEYGSMEGYFKGALGFTAAQISALKAKLLVGAPITTTTTTKPLGTLSIATPKITGRAKVGGKLTGHETRPAGATLAYQWMANGKAIAGATGSKLKVTKSLKGKRVSLRVVATKSGYKTATAFSKAVKVKG